MFDYASVGSRRAGFSTAQLFLRRVPSPTLERREISVDEQAIILQSRN
jgi:hypothetical protein